MPKTLTDETYDKISRALIYAREHVPIPDIELLFASPDVDELIDGAKKALVLLGEYKLFLDDGSLLGEAVSIVIPEPDSISITVRDPDCHTVTLGDLFEAPEAFPDAGKRTAVTGTGAPTASTEVQS